MATPKGAEDNRVEAVRSACRLTLFSSLALESSRTMAASFSGHLKTAQPFPYIHFGRCSNNCGPVRPSGVSLRRTRELPLASGIVGSRCYLRHSYQVPFGLSFC